MACFAISGVRLVLVSVLVLHRFLSVRHRAGMLRTDMRARTAAL